MLDNNRKCSVCDCVYPNPRALIRHFRTHVQSNKKNNIRLECDYCDTVFTNRDSISRHLKTQHGMTRNGDIIAVPPISCEQLDDGSLNECEFCSKIFKNGDALRLHMIRQHKSNSLDTPRSPIPDEETQPVLNTSRSTPLYPAVNTSSVSISILLYNTLRELCFSMKTVHVIVEKHFFVFSTIGNTSINITKLISTFLNTNVQINKHLNSSSSSILGNIVLVLWKKHIWMAQNGWCLSVIKTTT